jgi:hypothetical protein
MVRIFYGRLAYFTAILYLNYVHGHLVNYKDILVYLFPFW